MSPIPPLIIEDLAAAARQAEGLELLILFGSRARGDAGEASDWDVGYLAADAFDPAAFHGLLSTILRTDAIDLANLGRAGGLLRFRAARDGHVVFESRPGIWDGFRLEAVRFWCDAAAILERGYDDVLAGLQP